MNESVFIGIGSNIEPEPHIRAALSGLAELGEIEGVSQFIRNPAIGREDQPDYVNGVIMISTPLSAKTLKTVMRALEAALGRKRSADKFASRTIDLDVLLYGNATIPDLEIPDPHVWDRAIVAKTVAQIDGNLIVPVVGRTIGEIAEELPSDNLDPLDEFSRLIKKEYLH